MTVRAGYRVAGVLALALLVGGCAATADRPVSGDRQEAAEVHAELGIGYLREGEFEQAERNLRRALDYDPGYALANIGMAAVMERKGDTTAAEDHYRSALRRDPGNPFAQTNLGALLCGRGDFDEAQELFAKAIANPDYDRRDIAYMNSGVCHFDAGDREEAERQLRRALELDPQYPRALLEMARLTYDDGRPMQTRAFLQRLDGQGVQNAETLLLCYQAETALGNSRSANACADRLNRQFPDSPELEELRRLEREG
ncbi:type IV pilus biogenesis/stability protein PilW [Thioalkalivibrio sp. ALJ16]|uniref:type IV pilus biogenesis/stability protein PilW n=1 Tax=Thioalkalivibrio sp. ALJ16 TaxID=1158762 RepID=UPI0003744110|nr:type IV pilus biogenesis/stability protein PilW [Thioalkalivibrio sp. ALJ16]